MWKEKALVYYEELYKIKPEFKSLGETIIRDGKALLQDAINWSNHTKCEKS